MPADGGNIPYGFRPGTYLMEFVVYSKSKNIDQILLSTILYFTMKTNWWSGIHVYGKLMKIKAILLLGNFYQYLLYICAHVACFKIRMSFCTWRDDQISLHFFIRDYLYIFGQYCRQCSENAWSPIMEITSVFPIVYLCSASSTNLRHEK